MPAWNPALYLTFDRERTQPAIDLAARVEVARPQTVLDLGCGPGNSTAVLKARWPTAELAVQVPTHAQSALHRNILELANEPHWRDRLGGVHGSIHGRDPAFYYDVLYPFAGRIDLWETEYIHVLAGPEAILTWIRGTGLRPFLHALPDEVSRQQFEAELLERVTVAYPHRPAGKVLFPFRRLFFVAYQK